MTTNVPEPDDVISGSGPEYELPHISDPGEAPEHGHHTASPTAGTETGTESDATGPVGAAEVAAELRGYLDEVDEVVRERLTDAVLDARLAQIFLDSGRTGDASGDEGDDDGATGDEGDPGSPVDAGDADTAPAPARSTEPSRPDTPVRSGAPPFRSRWVDIAQAFQEPGVPKQPMRMGSCSWEALAADLSDRSVGGSLCRSIDVHWDAQFLLTMARWRAEQQEDAALNIAARTVRQARQEAERILFDARRQAARIVEGARTATPRIDDWMRAATLQRPLSKTQLTWWIEVLAGWGHRGPVPSSRQHQRPEHRRLLALPTGNGNADAWLGPVVASRQRRPPGHPWLLVVPWAGETEGVLLWERLERLALHDANPPDCGLLAAKLMWDPLGEEAVPSVLFHHPADISGSGKIQPVEGLATGLRLDARPGLAVGTFLSSLPCGVREQPALISRSALHPPPDDRAVARPKQDPPRAAPDSFWAFLTAGEQERFAAVAVTVRFAPDAVLLHEGDVADHALVIQSGLVRVVRRRAAEAERLIAMRGPGDVIGERATLEMQGRSATVTAATTVTALKISADDLRTFLDETPRVHAWLGRLMFDRLVHELTQDDPPEPTPLPASSAHVQVSAAAGAVEPVHEPGMTQQLWPAHRGKQVRAREEEGAPSSDSEVMPMPGKRTMTSPPPRCVTIVAVDLAPWARFPSTSMRSDLNGILRRACAAADLRWDDCYRQDRRDGVLLILPPSASPQDITDVLATRLTAVLHHYNQSVSPISRIRLRVAVHTGQLHSDDSSSDDHRFSERTLARSALMARAPLFKRAMDEAGADLGLILSDQAYGYAISQGGLSDPTRYIPVGIALPATPSTAERPIGGDPWSRPSSSGGDSRPTSSRSQAPAAAVSSDLSGFRHPWAAGPAPSRDAHMPDAPLEHLSATGAGPEGVRLGGSPPARTQTSITTRAWTWFPAGRELARG